MEKLFKTHRNYFLKIARENLSSANQHWAEDLVQDAYIKATLNKDAYNPKKGKLLTWATSITVRLCIDHNRKKGNQEIKSDNFSFIESDSTLDGTKLPIQVRPYLKDLSFNEQAVIRMRYFFNMKAREIAPILNVKAGNIPMMHKRALEKLRAIIEANEEYRGMAA